MRFQDKTYVMGIVNATPDSFSDGGRYLDPDQAVEHALTLVQEGADLIDIGAESTRPGFTPVGFEEEWRRLEPILDKIVRRVEVGISIDTYKPEIARQAIAHGATIINDIWGGKRDATMYEVIAASDVTYVMMHNNTDEPIYEGDIVNKVVTDLRHQIDSAQSHGVQREQIVLDPGIGFGKTVEQNIALLARLEQLVALGFPVLIGTSRKSMIGHVLSLPVDQREEGTAATVAIAIHKGASIVRVHDVLAMKRVTTMSDAIIRYHG